LLCFSRFSTPRRSFCPGQEIQRRKWAGIPAYRTFIFDIFSHLRITTPSAAAGESITTVAIDPLVDLRTITPPRRCQPSSPTFPRPNCHRGGSDTPPL
jgi:hypothetical protein